MVVAAAAHDQAVRGEQDQRPDDCGQPGRDVEEFVERVRAEEGGRQESADDGAGDADQHGDDDPARVFSRRDGLGDCACQQAENQERDDAHRGLRIVIRARPDGRREGVSVVVRSAYPRARLAANSLASRSCIHPIFMPKISSKVGGRRNGRKGRIVRRQSEDQLSDSSKIVALEARDIRFPTSRWLDGSDAMHTDPDYSAAYVVLRTDADDGIEGHGLTFTTGRGTEVCLAAVRALEPMVVGRTLESISADMRGFWRSLASDTQLRWLGPEKGVIHLATAAVVNAVWDLSAKLQGKPLWKLLADMAPEELVSCVDFRYIADALSPEEAVDLLTDARRGAAEREREIVASGYPAYTTSAGWLGYDDEKVESLVREALASGFTHVKMKVGADLVSDDRRARLIRRALGKDGT